MTVALVVDDHPEGVYLLRCLLAADGHQVLEARNGAEALAIVESSAVDIIVSDILMPVMDGFSLCRACKTDPRLQKIPFIFYTATYVDKRDEDLAMSLGADAFLVKPAEPEVISQRVREVLARQRAGAPRPAPEVSAEVPFLQQYSEVLIHKLEDKLQELERANQALRLKDFALASSASGILLLQQGGQIGYANPALVQMARKPAADLLGRPVATLFAEPAAFKRWFAEPTSGPAEMQMANAPEGASPIWVRVERHAIRGDGGTSIGHMLSCTDVTEERKLRRELARTQRLESLSLFAAGVAHDFNNLLMGILALLDIDADRNVSDADREANRAIARTAFERARDLTRRLLTFSMGTTSERQATDLRGLLDETISLSLSGSAVRCEKHYCDQPAVAIVNAGEIAQVLSNILVNARQAMDDRGSVVASVAVEDAASTAGVATSRVVKLTITDSGPGMAPDILDRIFEPYFTTKREGRGLGLATSHAIVTEHDGRISITSRPGAGTTFVVSLPAADPGAEPPTSRSSGRLSGTRNERILVMDDEVVIQSLLKQGLEKAGYSVVAVANGEQALLEFRRARFEQRPFQLAVLDITVKGGMGGIQTLHELRRIDPNLLAIATTGYARNGASSELQSHGFTGTIAKPFLVHELCATISAVL